MSELITRPAGERSYRLPRTVIPERYDLTLTPDLREFSFAGEEQIRVRIVEPVREILLNAAELEIQEASLKEDGGRTIGATVTLESEDERARIALAEEAGAGEWTLILRFTGILNDKLHGFYRSTYRDQDGQEQVLATTQFEATDARRAFPCWDEPDFKAVFGVTLIVDEDLMAISNAAAIEEKPLGNGKKAVRFADTIRMSTYLVAFIVGRLEATNPVDVDGTPLRVIAVPGKRHLADFALDVGTFSLRFFANYYGIPYPGDKLDMIAIPDFAAGAMENLGAVTYRETALLVDPQTAARAELERVADVIAHELAHMWFGDLVTMRWWNGLWLNEAFATFMEMLAVDAYKPEWERWVSFGLDRQGAMVIDGLSSTRPIEYPVHSPEEAGGMFDVLTYQKGAAVLRMLEQYIGAEEFRKGIVHYLERHRLDNAETTDLWDAIEEATGEPARRIMDSWIFQGGFPIVSVETAGDSGTLNLSQQRFRYLTPEADSEAPLLWHVPVMLRTGAAASTERRKVLLSDPASQVDLPAGTNWVVGNENGHGFYRVRYSPDLLRALTERVQSDLSAIERFNLVTDTWASVIAGLTPVRDFLDLARIFGDETDRNVWSGLLGGLAYINRMLPESHRPALQAFVRDLAGPALDRVGWERKPGESELIGQLRGTLVSTLGTLGEDAATQGRSKDLHAVYLRDRSSVDRDLVPAVVAVTAHTGGPEEYDLFVERYKSAATPQEEQRYLFALSGFRSRDLVHRTLDKTLTDEVRTQNAPFLVNSLLHHLEGGDITWAFIKENWETLVNRFPENAHVRMVEGITSLSTPEQAADIETFFETHSVRFGAKSLEQHLERLRVNLAFRLREAEPLLDYFGGQQSPRG